MTPSIGWVSKDLILESVLLIVRFLSPPLRLCCSTAGWFHKELKRDYRFIYRNNLCDFIRLTYQLSISIFSPLM